MMIIAIYNFYTIEDTNWEKNLMSSYILDCFQSKQNNKTKLQNFILALLLMRSEFHERK